MIALQRTLLGFGIAAVGIALFGFVVMGLFGMDSSQSFPMVGFTRDSVTGPMGPTSDMSLGMMGGIWTDPGDAAAIERAFPNADDLTVMLGDFAFDPF